MPSLASKIARGLDAGEVGGFALCATFTAIGLAVYCGLPWRWFSYHPLLMMVAWLSIAFTSIAVKRKGGRVNTIVHGYTMALGAVLTLMGYYVIYEQKIMLGKPHLTTYHSWGGLFVIVASAAGTIGSLAAFHPDFGAFRKNSSARQLHKIFFRIVTLAALVTILNGWYKVTGELWSTMLIGAGEALLAALLLTPKPVGISK